MTKYAVVRNDVFVESTFMTKEDAEEYKKLCESISPSHKFSIRNATVQFLSPVLERITLDAQL
jgi:hypothetical protein